MIFIHFILGADWSENKTDEEKRKKYKKNK